MGEDLLCTSCAREYTEICQHCGERIWNDDVEGDDNTTLCHRCFENNYTTCDECGRLVANSNSYELEDDDSLYCHSCYERRSPHSAIHEYSYKPEPIFFGYGSRYFGAELEIDDGGKDRGNAAILLKVANDGDNERVYIKADGSLDDGPELMVMCLNELGHERSLATAFG